MDKDRVTVWSSQKGSLCPACGEPSNACICARQAREKILGDGRVRVKRETAGRKGRVVSIITGLPLTRDGLLSLLKELKNACGTGGTLREGTLEIQGEHRDRLVEELKKRGYDAKKSGG